MVCLLVATVYWYKSQQFVKKKYNIKFLPRLVMILVAFSIITLHLGIIFFQQKPGFCVVFSTPPFVLYYKLVTQELIPTQMNIYPV